MNMTTSASPDASEIKARVNVPRLYRHLGGRVRTGDKVAHCFNTDAHRHGDKNASLQLHEDGFKCHACGVSGDCFELIKLWRGVDFKDALEECATFVGVSIHSPRNRRRRRRRRHSQPITKKRTSEPSPSQQPTSVKQLHQQVFESIDSQQPWGTAMETWCERRGINISVAWAIGMRPAVSSAIKKGLRGYTVKELKAAGWANDQGRIWTPFRRLLTGDQRYQGVLIPGWAAASPERPCPESVPAPNGWRWRLLDPITMKNGHQLKTFAMPGQPVHPLGIHVTDTWLDDARSNALVIIAEGEPDWLSLYDAMQVDAGVLGICDVGKGWRESYTDAVKHARRVVCMVHDTKAGQALFKGLYRELAQCWGTSQAKQRLIRWLLDEHNDANDLHRQGLLRCKVQEGLGIYMEELKGERNGR